ncbi:MAG: lysostaphin resistance A-like protein [Haloferacaceae archaeon]
MSMEIRTAPDASRGLALLRAVLVVFAAFLAVIVVGSIGTGLLADAGLGQDSLAYRVASSALAPIGFGVGLAGYLAASDDWALLRDHLRRPTRRDLAYVAAGVVVILVGAVAAGQLLAALGVEVAQNRVIAAGEDDPTFYLYMIPVSLLLVGPFEELVFRGAVQGVLRRAFRPTAAVATASAIFGLIHLPALLSSGSKLSYVFVAATLGLVLGASYELTGNVVVPAAVHGTYNAVLFGVQYAGATGLVG